MKPAKSGTSAPTTASLAAERAPFVQVINAGQWACPCTMVVFLLAGAPCFKPLSQHMPFSWQCLGLCKQLRITLSAREAVRVQWVKFRKKNFFSSFCDASELSFY